MSHDKLTKLETQILLEHAIACEGSSKAVARLLDIAESRVSEGRKGKWHLNTVHREIIRKTHGSPVPRAGEYHQLIKVADITDELLDHVQADRQIQILGKWQRSVEFREKFLSHFKVSGAQNFGVSENSVAEKEAAMDAFLNTTDMETWCMEAEPIAIRPSTHFESLKGMLYRDERVNSALRTSGINFNEDMKLEHPHTIGFLFLSIYLLINQRINFQSTIGQHMQSYNDCRHALPAKYTLADPGPRKSAFKKIEAVITGKKVFERHCGINPDYANTKCYNGILNDQKLGTPAQKNWHNDEQGVFEDFTDVKLPWQCQYHSTEITAYLSKEMKYHLLITLTGISELQSIRDKFAILDIPASHIYEYISRLDRWITGNKKSLTPEEIKWEIAGEGGHIPGAIYID